MFLNRIIVLPYSISRINLKISKLFAKFGFHSIFKPVNKISFTNLKDLIPDFEYWGIYEIDCECGKAYIGQTRRALKFRIKEHEKYVNECKINISSIAQHCWQCQHKFLFKQAKLIQKAQCPMELNTLEAFHIIKNKSRVVNDMNVTPHFSDAWKRVIFK